MVTHAHGVKSEEVQLASRTMPLILSTITLVLEPEVPRLTVTYTPTPKDVTDFDKYRFRLSDNDVNVQEKDWDDNNRKIVFQNLVPGRQYNVTVWTVSGEVTSAPLIKQDVLYPDPVSNINATLMKEDEITLVWTRPQGDLDGYEVQYLSEDGRFITNQTNNDGMRVTRLRPHRNYTFTVLTRSGGRQAKPVSATFSTLEATPGKVAALTPVDVRPNQLRLRWSLAPENQNGVLQGFILKYGPRGEEAMVRKFEPDEFTGVIQDLLPGKTYHFQIQAINSVGEGRVSALDYTMPVGGERYIQLCSALFYSRNERSLTLVII